MSAVAAVEPKSDVITVRSPRDGAVLAEVAKTPIADVGALADRARAAQAGWAALPVAERVQRMRRIRDRWAERGLALAQVLMREGGKSEAEALTSEVLPSLNLFDYWCKAAPGFLKRERVALDPLNFPKKRGFVDYEPLGVIALVTPWNYPSSIPLRALVPALLAGNALLWKPSELSPLTAQFVYDVFAPDLPEGLVALVQGDAAQGQAVIDARVDGVSFTGSAATGRKIAARTAERLIPVSLELGGKNAAIVLDDADLDRASAGVVWGALANGGQNCAAVSRVYVTKGASAEFERRVRAHLARVKSGPDAGEFFDVPPLINARQRERVAAQVDEAKGAGTEALAPGGAPGDAGSWYAPAAFKDPKGELAIVREETFGPAFTVTTVADEAEAVRRANEGDYGLSASVWTRDLARGERVAKQLDVGTVTVNNTSFTPVITNAPWSGRRSSGHGTTNSHRALAEMVKPRFILLDWNKGSEFWWFPHDESLVTLARGLLRFLTAGLSNKLAGLPAALKLLPARIKAISRPVV
jgi:acyl-CoA reductase-like NAD-dependent aldehyde dehydrogenase